MIGTAGGLLEVEEKDCIQHHQASSYGAEVVGSRELGSTIPYCLLQSDTKLGVVHGEVRMGHCTVNGWNYWKVVVDEWEPWNLRLMRMDSWEWEDDSTYTMMPVVRDYMPGLRHYKDRSKRRCDDDRRVSGTASMRSHRDMPAVEVGKQRAQSVDKRMLWWRCFAFVSYVVMMDMPWQMGCSTRL